MTLSLMSITRRLFQYLAYFLVVALIFEVGTRFLLHWRFIYTRVGGYDAASQRLNWARRSHDPAREFLYSFEIYDSRRGWKVKPGIRSMPVFGTEILNTNSRGLRGVQEFPYQRTSPARRVIVLGDSYTFGDEVSDDATYVRQLGRLPPNTEVLNFGVDGYGHDQMLLYLHDEGIRYRPDVVLLGYVWFDAMRGLLAFDNYAKPRFTLDNGKLRLWGVPVPDPATELAREKYRLRVLDLAEIATERVRWNTGINDRRARALTEALIDSMVALARSINAVPVVGYLPVLTELLDTSTTLNEHERALNVHCERRQIRCVFLRPRFADALRKGATFHTKTHWKAVEHRIAAEGIRDYLVRERLDR